MQFFFKEWYTLEALLFNCFFFKGQCFASCGETKAVPSKDLLHLIFFLWKEQKVAISEDALLKINVTL
jgi:hypothetical protein